MFSPRLFIEWDERGRLVFIPAEIMEMKTTHLLLCSEFFWGFVSVFAICSDGYVLSPVD